MNAYRYSQTLRAALLLLSLLVTRLAAADEPREYRCSSALGLSAFIQTMEPGETVRVSGICVEHVEIPEFVYNVTLDGQGTALISRPEASRDTVTVTGRGITIRGFTITGGRDGVNVRYGTVTVTGNVIERTGRDGVLVHRRSFALIYGNRILNNPRHGVNVFENSSARIGWYSSRAAPNPNLIQGNGGDGVVVARASSARIASNTIRANRGNGVSVERVSQADICSNVIDENQNGVQVVQNSGVNLGNDSGQTFLDLPNSSPGSNRNYGVRLLLGGYADGRLGGLTGSSGVKEFSTDAIDSLIP